MKQTSLARYYGVFSLGYIGLTIIIGIVIFVFDLENLTGAKIGVPIASAQLAMSSFLKRQNRIPTHSERTG